MSSSKDRNCLTLEDRKKVLEMSTNDSSARRIAEQMGCGKTQIQNLLKRRREIEEDFEENRPLQSKRRKVTMGNEEINDLTHKWFLDATQRRLPVSGPLLQEKARVIAKELGNDEFKGSNGWLRSFLKARQIVCKTMTGERGDVDIECVEEWKSRLPELLSGYEPKDVFNMDETGLQFKDTNTKRTFITKGEDCAGGKRSKVRVTLALCCSATGEKLKPLLIGKSNRPRCLKNINVKDLPVTYYSNKKAWMNGDLFTSWLKSLNTSMAAKRRKIILVIDNAPCHRLIAVSNIKVLLLPPNTTSLTQPLDAGIIQAFKLKFRKVQLSHIIAHMDGSDLPASSILKSVDMLNVVNWVNEAWSQVSETTISKCFAHCGFVTSTATVNNVEQTKQPSNDGGVEVSGGNDLSHLAEALFGCSLVELCQLESDFVTEEVSTIDWSKSLSDVVKDTRSCSNTEETVSSSDDEEDLPKRTVSFAESLRGLNVAKEYALSCAENELVDAISKVELMMNAHLVKKKRRQSKISDHFAASS